MTYVRTISLNLSFSILFLLVTPFVILLHSVYLSSTAATVVEKIKKCDSFTLWVLLIPTSRLLNLLLVLNLFLTHLYPISFCFLHNYLTALSFFVLLYNHQIKLLKNTVTPNVSVETTNFFRGSE